MCNTSFSAVVFTFAVILFCEHVTANVIPNVEDDLILHGTRNRRQIPDECRPPPPPFHNHHHPHHNNDDEHRKIPPPMCCELPNLMPGTPEAMAKCHEMVFARGHGNFKSHHHRDHKHVKHDQIKRESNDASSSEESHESSTPAPGSFQDKKECFANCVFNMSGLLTADEMLNEEILNQKLLEEVANNTKWATIVDPIFKKCVAAAKEANSQSQKPCKLGPHEYLKCMTRELFFNCPSDIWVNSSECNELKNKFEKCPNLSPPHWQHRHHHDQHHHHHHHDQHNHHHHESHEEKQS